MALEVGTVVEGKVSGITGFGAFIDLPEGKTGLVHISEVAHNYVKDIKEHLSVGQVVRVKVLTMEPNGKISLSIKKAVEPRAKAPAFSGIPAELDFSHHSEESLSFEDKMARFKATSDERMQDIKQNADAKRGSYRRGNN